MMLTCRLNIITLILFFAGIPAKNIFANEHEKPSSQTVKKDVSQLSPEANKNGESSWFYADTTKEILPYIKDGGMFFPFATAEEPAYKLALATNPFSHFLFNQIALSLDVIRAKSSHEFRYNYVYGARKLLWKTADDPGFDLPEIIWSGFQVSYTYKFTKQKPFDRFKWLYQGPQIRYASREYDDITVNLIRNNGSDTLRNQVVSSRSNVFDLVYMVGQQVRWKLLFLDIYGGAGVGYKTLAATTNSGLKYDEFKDDDMRYDEQIDRKDTRFKPTRWNRVYVPTRLGIRVGIIF